MSAMAATRHLLSVKAFNVAPLSCTSRCLRPLNVSGFLCFAAGCGNSTLSGDLYSVGYHSIANVDYSSVCIATMRARHSDCPGMTWHEMDISRLSFADASFDVVLEKATLDAIMVEEKSPWELSTQTASFMHKTLTEVPHPEKHSCVVEIGWI